MAFRHLIAAGSLAATCSTANVAAEPAMPSDGNAVARSTNASELAVGNWGDASVRRYRHGAVR